MVHEKQKKMKKKKKLFRTEQRYNIVKYETTIERTGTNTPAMIAYVRQ